MKLIIRDASKKDAERIIELYDLFYNDEWFNKYKKSRMKDFANSQRTKKIELKGYAKWLGELKDLPDDKLLVLEDKDKDLVVGFIVGFIRDRDKSWKVNGHLDDLYIIKEYRRKGYGKELMNHLLDWFKDKGCKYSSLEVDLINKKGIKFYEGFGYEPTMYKMMKKL